MCRGGKKTLNKKCPIVSEFWPLGLKRAGDDPLQYIELMEKLGYQSYELHGSRLKASKLSYICKLGIHDPFIVKDILFIKADYE